MKGKGEKSWREEGGGGQELVRPYCVPAHVQVAGLQIRGCSWSFSLELLQENVNHDGISSLSAVQVWLYPPEGSGGSS